MAFKLAASTGDRVGETGGHRRHRRTRSPSCSQASDTAPKPRRAEGTARPRRIELGRRRRSTARRLIEPAQLVATAGRSGVAELLAEGRLVRVDGLALDAGRHEQPDRPGGQRPKQLRVTIAGRSGSRAAIGCVTAGRGRRGSARPSTADRQLVWEVPDGRCRLRGRTSVAAGPAAQRRRA